MSKPMLDQGFDAFSATQARMKLELDLLRRAVRILAGLDRQTAGTITPKAMQTVCAKRGWVKTSTQCFPGDQNRLAFEVYDHATANSGYCEPCVKIPLVMETGDYQRRTLEWVMDMAARHGDVAPAEILVEVLMVL